MNLICTIRTTGVGGLRRGCRAWIVALRRPGKGARRPQTATNRGHTARQTGFLGLVVEKPKMRILGQGGAFKHPQIGPVVISDYTDNRK